PPHDSGVVDQHIQLRMVRGKFRGERTDGGGVRDVELNRLHSGIRSCHLVKNRLSPSGDDYLISQTMKSLRATASDAGSTTSHKNRISRHVHESAPSIVRERFKHVLLCGFQSGIKSAEKAAKKREYKCGGPPAGDNLLNQRRRQS